MFGVQRKHLFFWHKQNVGKSGASAAHDRMKRKNSICWLFATFFFHFVWFAVCIILSLSSPLAHNWNHFHFRLFLYVNVSSFSVSFFFLTLNLGSNDFFAFDLIVWLQQKLAVICYITSLPWMSLSYILYAKYIGIFLAVIWLALIFALCLENRFLVPKIPNSREEKHFDGRKKMFLIQFRSLYTFIQMLSLSQCINLFLWIKATLKNDLFQMDRVCVLAICSTRSKQMIFVALCRVCFTDVLLCVSLYSHWKESKRRFWRSSLLRSFSHVSNRRVAVLVQVKPKCWCLANEAK